MFKYIGIRGHRGAGKNTISFLLGTAIDYYTKHNSWNGFDLVYANAVNRVKEDEEFLDEADFRNIFFESFADTAKVMLSSLFGIPTDYMYDDWLKDAVVIDLVNFEFKRPKDNIDKENLFYNLKLHSAEELKELSDNNQIDGQEHVYTTLRELISYFSKYVMQKNFGRNVWIKSLEVNRWESERFYIGTGKTIYKIFTDCKFPSEISYIKNNKGIIIKINRKNNIKEDTNLSTELGCDNRFDFEINLNGDLFDEQTVKTIKDITLNIISND